MITYISDENNKTKIEVTFDSQEKLPDPTSGFEWIDISCASDYIRGVRVLLLEVITQERFTK